jgi:hypothetical protein
MTNEESVAHLPCRIDDKCRQALTKYFKSASSSLILINHEQITLMQTH